MLAILAGTGGDTHTPSAARQRTETCQARSPAGRAASRAGHCALRRAGSRSPGRGPRRRQCTMGSGAWWRRWKSDRITAQYERFQAKVQACCCACWRRQQGSLPVPAVAIGMQGVAAHSGHSDQCQQACKSHSPRGVSGCGLTAMQAAAAASSAAAATAAHAALLPPGMQPAGCLSRHRPQDELTEHSIP